MSVWRITTTVNYTYEVEADTEQEATAEGWRYEDHRGHAEVYDISVEKISEDEEENE
jgi:hypothetical protein